MKILGLIVVACFALAAAGMVTIAGRWFGAPEQLCAFLVAAIGAVSSCYGPQLLTKLVRQAEAQ